MSVDDDRGSAPSTGLSLEVRAGEIFGVAGVQGNGQRELVEAVTGMRPKVAGRVEILGTDATRMSPRQITELGSAHIPEDRSKHGLVGSYSHRRQPRAQPIPPAPFSRRLRPRHAHRAEAESWSRRSTFAPRVSTCRSTTCPAATSRRSSWPAS